MPALPSRRLWLRGAAVVLGGMTAAILAGCGILSRPRATSSPQTTPAPAAGRTPTPVPTPTLPALSIDDPASDWIVVDKLRPLNPRDYAPPLAAIPLVGMNGALRMRPVAAAAVAELAAQFRAETDLALGSVSDYRSYASQVRVYGRTRDDTLTARPGYSEHQTGLAIDFSSPTEGRTLQAAFGQTRTGQWLAANAWRWGFVLRYPDGLQAITGYRYEPWHFRYVGIPLATAMRERGTRTLEEWFGLPPAPAYP